MFNIIICGDRELFLKAYEITLIKYLAIKAPGFKVKISIFAREDFDNQDEYLKEIEGVIDLAKKAIVVIDEIKFGGSTEVISRLLKKEVVIIYYCDFPKTYLMQESQNLKIILRYGLDPELLVDTILKLIND